MLKTLYSSKIRQKQFYWTLVTKTVVHCLFAFGRLSFIFLKLNKKYSLSDRSTFSPRNCAITQFQIMKLYHLTPASMVYICFEVSIFCVYLYGVSHSVFAHKPGNVEQNKSIIARQHLNLQGKSWLIFFYYYYLHWSWKQGNWQASWLAAVLFVCLYACVIWKKWLQPCRVYRITFI